MTDTHESWDAFWSEVSGADRTEVIRGVVVSVPADIPLALEHRHEELSESDSFDDYAELVGMLFGEGVLTKWVNAGMGLRELQTAFAWGMAQGSGEDITFRQAYETVMAADDEGKPAAPQGANRAARRAAAKKPSASTGGRSKQTSSASTASARTTSR